MRQIKGLSSTLTNVQVGKIEPVRWTNLSAGIVVNGNSLRYGDPGGRFYQRRGACSRQVIYKGDVAIEFQINEIRPYFNWQPVGSAQHLHISWINAFQIGFSNADTSPSENTIGWSVGTVSLGGSSPSSGMISYQSANEQAIALEVKESGAGKAISGRVNVGSKVKIAIESGVVNYYLNGDRFYSSETPVSYPIVVDCTLIAEGASIDHANLIRGGVLKINSGISLPAIDGNLLRGFQIRRYQQTEATNFFGNPTVSSNLDGVFTDVNLNNQMELSSDRSYVLALAQMNGVWRSGDNIRGKFVIFNTGRDLMSADSAGNLPALGARRSPDFGDPLIGPAIGDVTSGANNGAYPLELAIGGLAGTWFTQPLINSQGNSLVVAGGNYPPETTVTPPSLFVPTQQALMANFTVGMFTQRGWANAGATSRIYCNYQGVSKLTLVELVKTEITP
jgi:hypothetical protein